jgi:electron transfer flavoprotein beta subunit
MGLPAAVTTLKDALYRGADEAILVTDARCAASDTLATSYILSCAVKRIKYDIVLCGRQAIDGDTAQVGPQLAEKLGVPQITYVEKPVEINGRTITVQRNAGNGWQKVKAQLPVLLTVTGEANVPRVAAAKKMMKYKVAMTPAGIEQTLKAENAAATPDEIKSLAAHKAGELEKKGALIKQWNLDFLKADLTWCGRSGSPTKVHRIQSVVLASKETKSVEPTDDGLSAMIHELLEDKIIA